jgi:hypothetical protein
MEIKGNILDGRILTGEEEVDYWKVNIFPIIFKKNNKKNPRQQNNRGRGRGNKRQKTRTKPLERKTETLHTQIPQTETLHTEIPQTETLHTEIPQTENLTTNKE